MLAAQTPVPLPDRGRAADRIFHELKRQIVSGELPRGSRLPTERELAEMFGVSAPTVREAIRGLTVIGFVQVRHGSGAVVSASGESLVAMSLGAVIQLKSAEASHALELLTVLNEYAATSAVVHATSGDLRRLRDAAESLGDVSGVQQAVAGVRAFHHALVHASHNPLLGVICDFLSDVQVEIAREVAEDSLVAWKAIIDELQPARMRFLQAVERRDARAASLRAREFHAEAIRSITSLPKAQEVRLSDPRLKAMLSSVVERMGRGAAASGSPEGAGR